MKKITIGIAHPTGAVAWLYPKFALEVVEAKSGCAQERGIFIPWEEVANGTVRLPLDDSTNTSKLEVRVVSHKLSGDKASWVVGHRQTARNGDVWKVEPLSFWEPLADRLAIFILALVPIYLFVDWITGRLSSMIYSLLVGLRPAVKQVASWLEQNLSLKSISVIVVVAFGVWAFEVWGSNNVDEARAKRFLSWVVFPAFIGSATLAVHMFFGRVPVISAFWEVALASPEWSYFAIAIWFIVAFLWLHIHVFLRRRESGRN